MTELLPIGGRVKHDGQWQKVAAVAWVGERYYWLINDYGVVSMVPAAVIRGEFHP